MSVKIQSLGMTTEIDGKISLVMLEDTMPSDCLAIFIKKEDYQELLEKLKELK